MPDILRSHIAGRWIGETADAPLASAIDGRTVAFMPRERPDFGDAVAFARRDGVRGLLALDFQKRASILRALAGLRADIERALAAG